MNHFDTQQTNRFTSPDMMNLPSYHHHQVPSPTFHHNQTSAVNHPGTFHNTGSATHTPTVPTSTISATSANNALSASATNNSNLPWSNDPIYEINDTENYLEDPTLPVPHRKTFFYHPNMKLKTHTNGKPPYSYATLITYAIMQSSNKQMSLNEIYQWMTEHYTYLKTAGSGWKNSVRHNLSLNKAFVRVARPVNEPGKGSYWTVDLVKAEEANFKSRNRGLRRGSDSVLGIGASNYMGLGSAQTFMSDVQRRNSMFPGHQPPQHGGMRTTHHHSGMPMGYGETSNGFPFASSNHQHNSLPSILNESTQSWGSQGQAQAATSPYDASGLTRSLPQPFLPPQSYFSHPHGTTAAHTTTMGGSPGPVNFGMVKGTTPGGYVGMTASDSRATSTGHHHAPSASYNPTSSTNTYYGGLSHAAM